MSGDRDDIAQALLEQQMGDLGSPGSPVRYPPLDARQLLAGGAVRVTQPRSGSSDPEDFSLITHWNDTRPGSDTPSLADKPASYEAAQQALADPRSGILYPGKYRQIQWSAEKRGMNTGY